MVEAAHQETSHAMPEPMDEGDCGKAMPDSNQHMVKDPQPETMQEELAKPVVRSVRVQDDMERGGHGTPKALASTLVSHAECHPLTP